MKIAPYGEKIPQSTKEIINKYGSLQEAALEEPELYSLMHCTTNPDSPFFDEENGYDVEYMEECIRAVEGFLKDLSDRYYKIEEKLDVLEDDIMDISYTYYEDYSTCRDSIGRLHMQKDLLEQELKATRDDLKMADDNIRDLYHIASTLKVYERAD